MIWKLSYQTQKSIIIYDSYGNEVEKPADRKSLKPFVLIPFDEQKGSLEFKQYASLISAYLNVKGYRRVKNRKQADYAIFFRYGIDDGRTAISSYPIYGLTGGGTTYHSGTISGSGGGVSSYSGTSSSTGSFGVVGVGTSSRVNYKRLFTFDMFDLKKSSRENIIKVFEGKVKSTGALDNFLVVSNCVIHSLFEGFPGRKSGEIIRMAIPIKKCSVSMSQERF